MELFLIEMDFNYSMLPPEYHDMYYITRVFAFLRLYVTPIIIGLGIIGNTIGTLTIYRTRMRTLSCIAYVTAVLTSDTLFLSSMFFLWISTVVPEIRVSNWWCLSTTYFTGITNFLSLWYSVAMASDKYLKLRFPGYFNQMSPLLTKLLPRVIVIGITTVGIVVYLNFTLLFGVLETSYGTYCVPLPMFEQAIQVLAKLDVAFNFIVPYGGLLFTMLHSAILLRKSCQIGSPRAPNASSISRSRRSNAASRQTRSLFTAEAEMTKVTLVVSGFYMIFNLPGHVVRFVALVAPMETKNMEVSQRLFVWQQILMFLFIIRPVTIYPACLASSRLLRRALRVAFTSNPDIHHPRRPSHLDIRNPITGNMQLYNIT